MSNTLQMIHPSYQLNPGDMFQVEIEKVMYGTGVQKQKDPTKHAVKRAIGGLDANEKRAREANAGAKAVEVEAEAEETEKAEAVEEAAAEVDEEAELAVQVHRVKVLLRTVRDIIRGDTKNFSAKQIIQLRVFRDYAKRLLARPNASASELSNESVIHEIQSQIQTLRALPAFRKADPIFEEEVEEEVSVEETSEQKKQREMKQQKRFEFKKQVLDKGLEGIADPELKERAYNILKTENLTKQEVRRLAQIMRKDAENPYDESKPYLTPWQPRPFMSAFAFIPRYLEVNPNICAAVYLRHPVARKGMAEVPTPFNYLTNQLAHNWYLERG